MAKAVEIDVSAWEPYAQAAARVVRVRTDELFSHAEGVLDTSDIERVHDMRVASRRLRAVLEIFAPCWVGGSKSQFRDALGDVKALADALGERRDPDVHIAAMDAFARAAGAAQRPGAQLLAARLRERQARGNDVLAAALEHIQRSDLRGRLLALADAAEEVVAA